jgi:hypothetical protein
MCLVQATVTVLIFEDGRRLFVPGLTVGSYHLMWSHSHNVVLMGAQLTACGGPKKVVKNLSVFINLLRRKGKRISAG